jgi:hypothetical protein
MSIKRVTLAVVLGAVGLSSAAYAAAPELSAVATQIATEIPEPSDFALFVIGVAGLIIGRRTARVRKPHKDANS